MGLSIEQSRKGSTAIIALEGKLNTETAPELEEVLDAWFEEGTRNALVDGQALNSISSAGLRALLECEQKIRGSDRRVVLAGFNEDLRQVCELAGFASIFTLYDTREQALASLEEPS